MLEAVLGWAALLEKVMSDHSRIAQLAAFSITAIAFCSGESIVGKIGKAIGAHLTCVVVSLIFTGCYLDQRN